MSQSSTLPTPTQKPIFPLTGKAIAWAVNYSKDLLSLLGSLVIMGWESGKFIVTGQINRKQCLKELGHIATDALAMGVILVSVSSAVIALQISQEMVKQGGETFVGALISLSLIRELSPIMSAIGLASVMGTAYASEIATMNSEQQMEALRVFHINPIRYVIVPRLLAGFIGLPAISILTTVIGVFTGLVVSEYFAEVQPHVFLDSVWRQTTLTDIWNLLIKTAVFGYLVSLISTTIGYNSKGNAKEVGIATTQAVVVSFVIVSLADYLLTYFLYD